MKNVIASFSIFVILILSMIFSINYVNKLCYSYKAQASTLEELLNKESWESSYKLSNTFLSEWEKDSKFISVFVDHPHIDAIQSETLKLTQYIKCKDKSNSLASVHTLKFLIQDISNFQKITVQNVF